MPTRDSRKRVSGRLFDKVWDRHLVVSPEGEPPLLYIDLHLVHEVTSPQAFEALELAGRAVRRPDLTVATMDHDVPTTGLDKPIADPLAAEQIARLREPLLGPDDVHDPLAGIAHRVQPDPELGGVAGEDGHLLG